MRTVSSLPPGFEWVKKAPTPPAKTKKQESATESVKRPTSTKRGKVGKRGGSKGRARRLAEQRRAFLDKSKKYGKGKTTSRKRRTSSEQFPSSVRGSNAPNVRGTSSVITVVSGGLPGLGKRR
jgi:hypothetical protein